jgi:hypothetical protein
VRAKNRKHITPKRLIASFSVAALFVLNIFLFLPFTIYQGNSREFAIPLASILECYLYPSLIFMAVLFVVGIMLYEKQHERYVSIIFVLGVLTWIQGNILVWEYGLLNGMNFNWARDSWRGWLDGVLWLMLLLSGIIFYKRFYKVAIIASIALISLQCIAGGFTSFNHPRIWTKPSSVIHVVPKEVFEFTSKQNVIHIIFDAFQSDFFQEIIESDPEYYKTALSGSVFFRETTGSFPTTYISIPAIFSGKNYQNRIPLRDFLKNTLKGTNVVNTLYDLGYEIDLVPVLAMHQAKFGNYFKIPVPYGVTKDIYDESRAAFMIDLVLFRCIPHFFKKYIYNDQLWRFQNLFGEKDAEKFRSLAHRDFLRVLIKKMSVERDGDVYKFMHFTTSHAPLIMNEKCEYIGKCLPYTRENFTRHVKCSLTLFIEFIDKLKALGIYDKSLMILHADHGAGIPVTMRGSDQGSYSVNPGTVGSALPLLAIKPPYGHGPMKTSDAQTMLTDIPPTVSSVLGLGADFPGLSVFEVPSDEKRDRRYHHYKWRNEIWQAEYLPNLTEYAINGSAFDAVSWQIAKIIPGKEISYETSTIDIGNDKYDRFLRTGWGGCERNPEKGVTYAWALGNSASVFLSLPKKKTVKLTANVKTPKFEKPQIVAVKVDGKVMGSWKLLSKWAWEKHSVVVVPDGERPDVSIVEFLFSQCRKPDERVKRPLAVLFESITLDEFKGGS